MATHTDPLIEVHPDTARVRDIDEFDWVVIRSHQGAIRARKIQVRRAISLNFSKLISNEFCDPVSGSYLLRAYACQLERVPPSFDQCGCSGFAARFPAISKK